MDPTRRERRRQRRQDEITDAAMEMIAEDGIAAFSVNKLADAVNLTPGALYRYFDSREMILAEVEFRVLEEFDQYFEAIDEALEDERPLTRVIGLAYGYVRLEELRPERFKLLSHFVSGFQPILSDEVAARLIAPTLQIVGRIAVQLGEASAAGELDEDESVDRVAVLWSALHGVLERRKLARFAPQLFDPTRLAASLLRTLFVGWGADAGAVDDALQHFEQASLFREILEDAR